MIFPSIATNLAVGAGTAMNVYRRDFAAGTMLLLSAGLYGANPSGNSSTPTTPTSGISADGSAAVFQNTAGNLDPDDTNGAEGSFLATCAP